MEMNYFFNPEIFARSGSRKNYVMIAPCYQYDVRRVEDEINVFIDMTQTDSKLL